MLYDKSILDQPNYNPHKLLDTIMDRLVVKNDAALARKLEIDPATVSKIRQRTILVSSGVLLRMHEESQYSIAQLKELMGIKGVSRHQA